MPDTFFVSLRVLRNSRWPPRWPLKSGFRRKGYRTPTSCPIWMILRSFSMFLIMPDTIGMVLRCSGVNVKLSTKVMCIFCSRSTLYIGKNATTSIFSSYFVMFVVWLTHFEVWCIMMCMYCVHVRWGQYGIIKSRRQHFICIYDTFILYIYSWKPNLNVSSNKVALGHR